MTTEIFGDFRDVGPVKLPHAIRVLQDGQPFATGTVRSAIVNGVIDPKLFERAGAVVLRHLQGRPAPSSLGASRSLGLRRPCRGITAAGCGIAPA